MKACRALLSMLVPGLLATGVSADIIHNDDVITILRHCMGSSNCVDGENFGVDTLRLKHDNTRLNFFDTSSSVGFPTNDWRLVANDTFSGGASYFAIQDAGASGAGGTNILRVDAGAPANSVLVTSSGRVGFRTATPVLDLHVNTSNTPAIRFEQNSNGGFSSQVWDIGANEANFFVRDVTAGSKLPLRIYPGSQTNTLAINSNGVGIMTSSPQTTLHVLNNNGTTQLLVQEDNAGSAARTLLKLANRGNTKFEIEEVASGVNWGFTNSGTGFRISKQGSGKVEFDLLNNGNLTIAGALTQNSDVNEKQNIVPVDSDALLARLSGLPISQWQYKDAPGENHIGPMAQDFYAAFGLGSTDTGLSTLDTSGIALLGVQALLKRNDELEAANRQLNDRVRALENQQLEIRAMLTELLDRASAEQVLATLSPP